MSRLFRKSWPFWLLLSLTLGLAPFKPEPHLIGKIRWVLGGARGMQAMDWVDLFVHAAPWVMLLLSALGILRAAKHERVQSTGAKRTPD